MIKSRRKLRPMKVLGKVYDPMPHNPTTEQRAQVCARTRDVRTVNVINIPDTGRKSKFIKKLGVRRVTYR